MILVRAGDKAVLNCETDSLPEPTVTWHKDGQPLVLAQRTQALQDGQRLEIRDTQVSSPMVRAAVGAVGPGPGPGEPGRWGWVAVWQGVGLQLCQPHTELVSSLRGGRHEKSTGLQIWFWTDLEHIHSLSHGNVFSWDLEAFSWPL